MTDGVDFRAWFVEECQRVFGLTLRQAEIVYFVRCGSTNKQIEGHLGLKPSTVKAHLYTVFKLLGVHSRAELVAMIDDSLPPGEHAPRKVLPLPHLDEQGVRSSSE